MSAGLQALQASLRQHGGVLGELVDGALPPSGDPAALDPAALAMRGPRASRDREEYRLLIETILEGSRLHYGPQRLARTDDPDLALLAGDQLYALGLSKLAALGDLDAVVELADVISGVAGAVAAGRPEQVPSIWNQGALGVGWGEQAQVPGDRLAENHDSLD